jgi:HK97 family phage major capsid protein/HK97 family phage prohead protease
MTLKRAHSILTITKADTSETGERVIEGIASTAAVDSYGDVVEPTGAVFDLPMPLLWQHHPEKPVGHVEFAEPTKSGVPFKARIFSTDEQGIVKDRLDEAWQSVKLGLVRAVSIGFQPIEYTQLKDGGYKFTKWKWVELSLVTIPANSEATIDLVRSIDRKSLASSGKPGVRVVSTKASVDSELPQNPKQGKNTMDLKKQLQAAQAARLAKSARMEAIMKAAAEDGERTLDSAESEEFDGLVADIDALDSQIKRLEITMKNAAASAAPVNGGTPEAAAQARSGVTSVSVRSNAPKGLAFTRFVKSLAASKGNLHGAAEFAKQFESSTPEVSLVLRAAVAAGTTSTPGWAAELAPYNEMTGEFLELLYGETVVDKMTGVRRVPSRVKVPTQTSGSTAGWVGEAQPKPVSSLGFGQVVLDDHKVAGIVVISQELARSSSPSAEQIVQNDLIKAIAKEVDLSFLDPANAGVSGVSPASVLNGAPSVPASGNTAAALRADALAALELALADNQPVTGLTWVMSPRQALAISLMQNSLGTAAEFPGVTATGGTFLGLSVVVSDYLPYDTNGSIIALVRQSDILLAADGGVLVDTSTDASLLMDTNPAGNPTGRLTSMFQNNLIAIRAERFISWVKGRQNAAVYISGADYRIA